MKIVFVDESTIALNNDIDFSAFTSLGEYVGYPHSSEEEVISRAAGAEVVVPNKVRMTRRIIEELGSLRLIAEIATGFDNIDLQAAQDGGVRVCNVAGYAATTVPQHAFALILNLATKAHRYHADVMAGEWAKATSFNLLSYPAFELHGLTLGVIGFGAIGQGSAKIAEGFGMRVLAHDAFGIAGNVYPNTDLDSLLRQSDVITIHCPLTEDTHHLIDAAAIEKMKPTALIINTARGGIVDERALADALNGGRIGGAGIDVLSMEPPAEDNPLLDARNVIITPHCAWSTREARQRLVDEMGHNIEAFFRGEARNVIV